MAGSVQEPKLKLGGGSQGFDVGECKVQISLTDFHNFYIIQWERPARLHKLKASSLCPEITAGTQEVPKGSSWQGDSISDFKVKTII